MTVRSGTKEQARTHTHTHTHTRTHTHTQAVNWTFACCRAAENLSVCLSVCLHPDDLAVRPVCRCCAVTQICVVIAFNLLNKHANEAALMLEPDWMIEQKPLNELIFFNPVRRKNLDLREDSAGGARDTRRDILINVIMYY